VEALSSEMMGEITGVSGKALHVLHAAENKRKLICTSTETKMRRHDWSENALSRCSRIGAFNLFGLLHQLPFKIPIYCAFITWHLAFSIRSISSALAGSIFVHILYTFGWARTRCIITSRLVRSLVGFISSVLALRED